MQIKNQQKPFGVASMTVVVLLSISILSCTKSSQLSSFEIPAEEIAANAASNEAASTYQGQQTWPMDQTEWIPCANNGNGEYVKFEGYVHFTSTMTVNNNHFTLVTHINPNEVSGTGLTTGSKYVASGGGQQIYSGSFINGQSIAIGYTRFMFTGAGPGNNLAIVFKAQVIVNASGDISNQSLEIKNTCN